MKRIRKDQEQCCKFKQIQKVRKKSPKCQNSVRKANKSQDIKESQNSDRNARRVTGIHINHKNVRAVMEILQMTIYSRISL
jgi:hypothetical protein